MPQKPSLARRAQCFGKPRTGRGKLSPTRQRGIDRKSTRLNSSHSQISYAAFCLKKKQVECVAEVANVLQIPAFLCRQTDLITEAALSGRAVYIINWQLLAPEDAMNLADKAATTE